MALIKLSAITSSSTVSRRRLPLVGAFCVLSSGLSNLCPSLSLSSKTGCAQSLPLAPLFSYLHFTSINLISRSKFSSQTAAQSVDRIRMEANNKTVPSIVVYVTVPNKEAGKKLAESIVKEKLAACVNRVPGIESVYQWQGGVSFALYQRTRITFGGKGNCIVSLALDFCEVV
ncbi:unnamed protein product [Ilex paraguariensis]|uniref:Protein CutA, chloroplastic n=1 Tax=Ilex paraguariensis TaxID=185542 RepID=A0ABC8RVI8_9AQUA